MNAGAKDKKTGVLMGGLSSERQISLNTGAAVLNALLRQGYNAEGIDIDRDAAFKIRQSAIDTAFIALHGRYGEDGCIQGLLEVMGIAYTGSDVLASAVAMNKALSKQIFICHGLTTPRFEVVKRQAYVNGGSCEKPGIAVPLVVKPVEEGSTIGISVVKTPAALPEAMALAFEYADAVLIEEYITGREITVGVLDGEPLPLIEIRPKSGFYSYASKYNKGETEYIMPPEIDSRLTASVQDAGVKAFNALGCSGAARADFIVSEDATVYILEVNTIPGMTETSLLPMAAKQAGIDFDALVERILLSAARKQRVRG